MQTRINLEITEQNKKQKYKSEFIKNQNITNNIILICKDSKEQLN